MLKRLVFLTLALTVAFAAVASAQTVDEIIAKYVDARGGMDALKNVKSAKFFGKTMMQGLEAPGILYVKRPDKVRMEFTIQGQTMIQAYDGTTGWYIAPFMGKTDPEKMSDEDAEEIQEMADIEGPMVEAKSKGNTIELIGKEDLEGAPAYKLKLTRKNGNVDYVYIDAEYFLEVKTTSKRMRQGAEIEVDNFPSDYKDESGIMMAHSQENKMNGQTVSQYNIDSVQFNIDIPDSVFAMPAVAAKPDSTKADE